MFKIIVVGLLYCFLSRSKVTAESIAKIQLCPDFFQAAASESLDGIDMSVKRKIMGQIRISENNGKNNNWHSRGNNGNKVKWLLINGMECSTVISQISSSNIVNTTMRIVAYYEDESQPTSDVRRLLKSWILAFFSPSKKNKMEKSAVVLLMDTTVTMQIQIQNGKPVFSKKNVDIFLSQAKSSDENTNIDVTLGNQTGDLKAKISSIIDKTITILNGFCAEMLNIDPSGNEKLTVRSVSRSNSTCMEWLLDLESRNLLEGSGKNHGILKGSGISLTNDFVNSKMNYPQIIDELNQCLMSKDLEMSPEDFKKLFSDASETDELAVKVLVTEPPRVNIADHTMIINMKLLGHVVKSNEPAFDCQYSIILEIQPVKQGNTICFQLMALSKQEVHNQNSNIGILDPTNLGGYLWKVSEQIIPCLNSFYVCIRVTGTDFSGPLVVSGGSIQISTL